MSRVLPLVTLATALSFFGAASNAQAEVLNVTYAGTIDWGVDVYRTWGPEIFSYRVMRFR